MGTWGRGEGHALRVARRSKVEAQLVSGLLAVHALLVDADAETLEIRPESVGGRVSDYTWGQQV